MKKITNKILSTILVLSSLVGFSVSVAAFAGEENDNEAVESCHLRGHFENVEVDGILYDGMYHNNEVIIERIRPLNDEIAQNTTEFSLPKHINGLPVTQLWGINVKIIFPNLRILRFPEGFKKLMGVCASCPFVYLPSSLEEITYGISVGEETKIVVPENCNFNDEIKAILKRLHTCTPEAAAEEAAASESWCNIM